MSLRSLIARNPTPEPWSEGDNIPWNEPGFSARMLTEHLSQAHDAASRRFEKIERHVGFIHHLLGEQPGRILDLGCGPGLYATRLARLGHQVSGIDYSPASVEYARSLAESEQLGCRFDLADLRTASFGAGFDLAMLIYGELNVFPQAVAAEILTRVHAALAAGGLLLLEPHTFEGVRGVGCRQEWWTSTGGLFSARPHLVLEETFWNDADQTRTDRYYVIDAETAEINRHAASYQAYRPDEYNRLLVGAGFRDVQVYPSLTGEEDPQQPGLFVLTARK
ncbi:MAG TPA: methyltransferase domain-containing protein [Anaerolineaceae bacterium]|nr:methyltransferase domain-containing protein [Anaerolineaceae bacterium]